MNVSPPARVGPHDLGDSIFPGRAGRWSGWLLALVAGTVLFTMMCIAFIDVFGRKFLNSPLAGAYEITEFLMGMLIFSALPLVTAREGHVTIDVFDHFVPARWRRWQQTVVTAICAVVLAYIAWRLWLLASEHVKHQEQTMTLRIPHGPFTRFFAVMAGLAALACFVNGWDYLRGRHAIRAPAPGDAAG